MSTREVERKGDELKAKPRRRRKLESRKKGWYYIDVTGRTWGPYQTNMMQQWHNLGYFHDELMLCNGDDGIFTDLRSLGPEPFKRRQPEVRRKRQQKPTQRQRGRGSSGSSSRSDGGAYEMRTREVERKGRS